MKKIVALVLSLVMALSLATIAFGATIEAHPVVDGKINEMVTIEVEKVAAKSFATGEGWVEHYKDADADGVYYVPCDKADATVAIYTNHGITVWAYVTDYKFDEFDVARDAVYDFSVTAQKATEKPATCDKAHYLEDGYVDGDGNFFVEADDPWFDVEEMGAKRVKLGNKVITVRPAIEYLDYIPASHIFGEPKANEKTGYDEVTCLVCKGVFAATDDEVVLADNKVAVKDTFAYSLFAAQAVKDDNDYSWQWGSKFASDYAYVWSVKAGSTTTNKDGVTSAKTFDAGIAMYVGMSLLSVAGGAVVIGKKKEF